MFGSTALKMCMLLFSLLKANNEDPFSSSTSGSVSSVTITKNLFEEPPAKNEDVPPALPPKTGTPTRPCPPPPGKGWHWDVATISCFVLAEGQELWRREGRGTEFQITEQDVKKVHSWSVGHFRVKFCMVFGIRAWRYKGFRKQERRLVINVCKNTA